MLKMGVIFGGGVHWSGAVHGPGNTYMDCRRNSLMPEDKSGGTAKERWSVHTYIPHFPAASSNNNKRPQAPRPSTHIASIITLIYEPTRSSTI